MTTTATVPASLGDAMSAIGRYTESEGGNSEETQQARANLFDIYYEWCRAGRPDFGARVDELRQRFVEWVDQEGGTHSQITTSDDGRWAAVYRSYEARVDGVRQTLATGDTFDEFARRLWTAMGYE